MALERESKGGEKKEGGGVFVVSTRAVKKRVMTKMTGSNGFSPHKSHSWKQLNWQQMKHGEEVRTVDLGERYLQSGSVHVSRQFSSPSTGYHEHFIGVHLQRETRVSGHVTPVWTFSEHKLQQTDNNNTWWKKRDSFLLTVLPVPVIEGTVGGRAGVWPGMRAVLQVLKGWGRCRVLHCAHFWVETRAVG